jgi:hypothetical protein
VTAPVLAIDTMLSMLEPSQPLLRKQVQRVKPVGASRKRKGVAILVTASTASSTHEACARTGKAMKLRKKQSPRVVEIPTIWSTPVKAAAPTTTTIAEVLPSGLLSPTDSVNTERLAEEEDEQNVEKEEDVETQLRRKHNASGRVVDELCQVLDLLQTRVCACADSDSTIEATPVAQALLDCGDGERPVGYLSLWFEFLAKATRASDRTLTCAVMQMLRMWTKVVLQPRTIRRTLCVALLVQCRNEEPHSNRSLYEMQEHWADVCTIPLEHMKECEARYLATIEGEVAISASRLVTFQQTVPKALRRTVRVRSPPEPEQGTPPALSVVSSASPSSSSSLLPDDADLWVDHLACPSNIFWTYPPVELSTLPDESSFVELDDLDLEVGETTDSPFFSQALDHAVATPEIACWQQ